jgi:protein involved in polysaccharide export with SLBB domain
MFHKFQNHSQSVVSVLLMTLFAALSFQAKAQMQVAAPVAAPSSSGLGGMGGTGGFVGNPNAAQGVPGLVGAPLGALPTAPNLGAFNPMGGAQAPGSQQARDLGASDASNSALTPQRAPRTPTLSQFQRFVQAGTGNLLPHFGSNLFDNPQTYAPDAAAPAPAEYVLGQGDEVRIRIWGSVDYADSQTIDRNGQITLPKIGSLQLSGVQVKDLESTLRKHVSTVFNNVTLSASLGKLRGITVYVVGQAQQPGTYNLSSLSTLVNAVFASGGPGANGSMRNIQLRRGGQTITTLDLYDFIAQGDKSKDARLQPGDVIMIPPAGPRVALTGATDHQAIYELKPGNTVQSILQLGGGLATLTTPQKALLERVSSQQKQPRLVQEIVLNAQGLQQTLQDGDVLTLFGISPQFSNAVTLRGNVAEPLRYSFTSGMRISDLIPEPQALIQKNYFVLKNGLVQLKEPETINNTRVLNDVKNLLQEVNWDYAAIERLDPKEVKTTLVTFNLRKAVIDRDPQHNLVLQPGDVVTVFSVNDVPVPVSKRNQFVRIGGEVKVPGIYQISPGETLPQLLQRVGGLTSEAYLFGAEFTRESVRQLQQKNLDQVIRRLEAQASSASATLTANLSPDRVAQASALQQQQMAQQRAQIDKLKTMRSQGRVSLELDSALHGRGTGPGPLSTETLRSLQASLPALPLEDGDTFLVPSLPAFVSAAGSVNNENSLIYKPGRTVGDVIKSAGLTEEANAKAAFVLRADGSILSRQGAHFFNPFESLALMPGDTLVVPAKVDRETSYNFLVRALRDWTQIFSNLGIGAAAIRTLRN